MRAQNPSTSFQIVSDGERWRALLGGSLDDDLYYSWEYLALWAREEHAEPIGLFYESENRRVVYPLLRVPLDALLGVSGAFDLRTPYDFGGPRSIGEDDESALREFDVRLRDYCQRNRIASEFARLHPFASSAVPLEATFHAQNFLVDLRASKEEIARSQHSSHRWAARAAARRGLEFDLASRPENAAIDRWIDLYGQTMERVGGGAAYAFSATLFRGLLAMDGVRLASALQSGETIAAALFVESGEDLFYFLSASAPAARPLNAMNFLLDGVIDHALHEGRRRLHLGGGSSALRHFKGQVATGTTAYYVRRRIHDQELYARLASNLDGSDVADFPAYRRALLARRQASG